MVDGGFGQSNNLIAQIVKMDIAPCILTSLETKSVPKLDDTLGKFRSLNAPLIERSSALTLD